MSKLVKSKKKRIATLKRKTKTGIRAKKVASEKHLRRKKFDQEKYSELKKELDIRKKIQEIQNNRR